MSGVTAEACSNQVAYRRAPQAAVTPWATLLSATGGDLFVRVESGACNGAPANDPNQAVRPLSLDHRQPADAPDEGGPHPRRAARKIPFWNHRTTAFFTQQRQWQRPRAA